MKTYNVGENKQIILCGYDWRNSILNWTINGRGVKGNPIYHISFELFRFKISWHWYGSI
jgi:hypothetical protein